MTTDAFTLQHLHEFCSSAGVVWARDMEQFEEWVLELLEDDPGLADQGWRSLYQQYLNRPFLDDEFDAPCGEPRNDPDELHCGESTPGPYYCAVCYG